MATSPLSLRAVLASWLTAAVVWPLAWWAFAAVQGVGVSLAGGEWIGVSVPLGGAPWALVNEPGISYAISRSALFGYWLAAPAAAAVVAVIVPLFLSAGRGWLGEVALLQGATAAAVLGLAWAPARGVAFGSAAGLARFWNVRPSITIVVSLVAGVAAVQWIVARLGSGLWNVAGGPLRRRRLLVAVLHVGVPLFGWLAAVSLTGWSLEPVSTGTVMAAFVAALLAGWIWTPRHPRQRRDQPSLRGLTVAAILAAGVAWAALWAGAPAAGGAKALLWGRETTTSNVPVGMTRIPLRPLLGRPAPPATSSSGS